MVNGNVFVHLTVSRSGGCVTIPIVPRLAVSSWHTPDRTPLIALTTAHRALKHINPNQNVCWQNLTWQSNRASVCFSPDSRLRPARTHIREAHSRPPPRVWCSGHSAAHPPPHLPECKAPVCVGRPSRTSPDTDVNRSTDIRC